MLIKDNYGILVTDVRIKRTDLPEENEESVYKRMISERESKAQEYLSKGDAEKNRITADTDRKVKELLSTAEADAEVIRAEGEGEAARIYNQSFSKDADFYQLYRTLESYKKTVGEQSVIILPSDSPYAKMSDGIHRIAYTIAVIFLSTHSHDRIEEENNGIFDIVRKC